MSAQGKPRHREDERCVGVRRAKSRELAENYPHGSFKNLERVYEGQLRNGRIAQKDRVSEEHRHSSVLGDDN